MSTDARCLSLADYVRGLVDALSAEDPVAFTRLRAVVGGSRARIELDDEAVAVHFEGEALQISEDRDVPVDGTGATDRQTVLELLDGYLEVTDAIAADRLRVRGQVDAVARMFHAIELLIDGAARGPALQELADAFRSDPCREPRRPPDPPPARGPAAERDLLARYGLLP
jgi:hypothetical protein